ERGVRGCRVRARARARARLRGDRRPARAGGRAGGIAARWRPRGLVNSGHRGVATDLHDSTFVAHPPAALPQRRPDGLDLEVGVEAGAAVLAADAGLLVAAERSGRVGHAPLVDVD